MQRGKRAIETPGGVSADETQGTPGPAHGPDDLSEYDSDELPPSPAQAASPTAGLSPEIAALVEKMVSDGIGRALAAKGKPKAGAAKLPSVAEAAAKCDEQVRNGVRPRGVLTDEGYYCHPEMARVRDHGVAQLKV